MPLSLDETRIAFALVPSANRSYASLRLCNRPARIGNKAAAAYKRASRLDAHAPGLSR
jgi:hypothetical protein